MDHTRQIARGRGRAAYKQGGARIPPRALSERLKMEWRLGYDLARAQSEGETIARAILASGPA